MLYIGENVGLGSGPKVDIALDPLEGTTICATGGENALAVIAAAQGGHFLHAPDTYMDKIATGPEAAGVIDLDLSPEENVQRVAEAKGMYVEDVTVCILNRPRHQAIIDAVRKAGARIKLIQDGDVAGGIATAMPNSGVDLMIGTGGAPEGVITAAALKCLGGGFQGRLNFRNEEEKARALKMGVTDLNKKYDRDELAKGQVMFAATGVTDGNMLKGVRFHHGGATTFSVVMRSQSQTLRYVEADHRFDYKPHYR